MTVKKTSLPPDVSDGPSEAEGLLLADVLLTASASMPFQGLSPAFQAALNKGGRLPRENLATERPSRNRQLSDQQAKDKTALHRTMEQMGGQHGFRKKKGT